MKKKVISSPGFAMVKDNGAIHKRNTKLYGCFSIRVRRGQTWAIFKNYKIPENCFCEHNFIFAHILLIIFDIISMFLFILLCIVYELYQIVRYILCEGLPRNNCANI